MVATKYVRKKKKKKLIHLFWLQPSTVKPRYNAPAFNIIPPIEQKYFGPKKYFHSYLNVGNKENLGLKHDFRQSLEMRYSGV